MYKLKARSFYALESENASGWLEHFEMVSGWYRWNDHQSSFIFFDCMEGAALNWFLCLDREIRHSFSLIKKNFNKRYVSEADELKWEKLLQQRKQGEFESVESYTQDMERIFSRVAKTERERTRIHLYGLKQSLRLLVYIIQKHCQILYV